MLQKGIDFLQAHQQNLNAKGKDMIERVNQAIGTSICMTAADLLVVSSAATMIHIDNKVDIFLFLTNRTVSRS